MCCSFGVFDNMRVLEIIPVLHCWFVVFGVCSQTILRVLKIIPERLVFVILLLSLR